MEKEELPKRKVQVCPSFIDCDPGVRMLFIVKETNGLI